MTKMKKHNKFKILSGILCLSLLLSSMPTFALDSTMSNQGLELDATIPVEEKAYSLIFQYGNTSNKNDLISAIDKAGGTLEYEIDFMNAVSAMLTMEQLAVIKEMECVKYVERNYDYNFLTEDTDIKEIKNATRVETAIGETAVEEDVGVVTDTLDLNDATLRKELAGEPPAQNIPDLSDNDTDNHTDSNDSTPIQDETLPQQPVEYEPNNPFAYAHEQSIKGQNIKIALFDTGIAEHSEYEIAGGVSFIGDMASYADLDGHGTQMAGIIAAAGENNPNVKGASPESELYAVKLVEKDGFITTAAILMGIEWSIRTGMNIINMSFGTYSESKLLKKAIDLAYENDILFVGAVGNDGDFKEEYRIMYPAAYDHVIAVGAGNSYGTESFSNNNVNLDFVASGRLQTTMLADTYTEVVGTSASAAYVTGLLAGLWSYDGLMNNEDVLSVAKKAAVVSDRQKAYVGFGEINLENGLKNYRSYATLDVDKASKNSAEAIQAVKDLQTAALASINNDMPMSMESGDCFANEMASAITIPFINWQSGSINCSGNEVWYKFTANVNGVHPNGSPGWYTAHTQGSLDTVGYLYDSSGNQLAYNDDNGGDLNFNFWVQLNYGQTYYIRLRAYGSNIGSYQVRVSYFSDDHGNTLGSATNVNSVYYNNSSVTGALHSQGDIDVFRFVPARDCVMEVYTEGSTDTYGTLYNECQSIVAQDNSTGGNSQFKITYHFNAMQHYYIAVRHNSSTGYGNYTLKFKFVKDWKIKTGGSVAWANNEYVKDDSSHDMVNYIYLNYLSGLEYHYAMTHLSTMQTIRDLFFNGSVSASMELMSAKLAVSLSFVEVVGIGLLIDWVYGFTSSIPQNNFEISFDQIIANNNQGLVKCINIEYSTWPYWSTQKWTEFSYFNESYMYGAQWNRGLFSNY